MDPPRVWNVGLGVGIPTNLASLKLPQILDLSNRTTRLFILQESKFHYLYIYIYSTITAAAPLQEGRGHSGKGKSRIFVARKSPLNLPGFSANASPVFLSGDARVSERQHSQDLPK